MKTEQADFPHSARWTTIFFVVIFVVAILTAGGFYLLHRKDNIPKTPPAVILVSPSIG